MLSSDNTASYRPRADLHRQVLDAFAVPVRLEPCPTADVPRPAVRPKNAALDKLVLRLEGRAPMPYWLDALQIWLSEIRHA